MAQIFLYNITDPVKAGRIRTATARRGIYARVVARSEFSHPIGYLTGRPGFAPGTGEDSDFDEEMLLLDSLSQKELSGLLDDLRAAGATVALKAVVTDTNAGWNSSQLHAALKMEHAALHGGGKPPIR